MSQSLASLPIHIDDGTTRKFTPFRSLLVGPVHQAGAAAWQTYLPAGTEWVHLWSGIVFFRAGSGHRALFEQMAES